MSCHGVKSKNYVRPERACRVVIDAACKASGIDAASLLEKCRRRELVLWRAAAWVVIRERFPSITRMKGAKLFDLDHSCLFNYEQQWKFRPNDLRPRVDAIIKSLGENQ